MKLTDTEKREILKLIEADKPLPDKYRFMLFDDKRGAELVWNGKTSESGKSIHGHLRAFLVK